MSEDYQKGYLDGYKIGFGEGFDKCLKTDRAVSAPPVKFPKVRHPRRTREEYTRQVRIFIEGHPEATAPQILDCVGGAMAKLSIVLGGLVEGKIIKRTGKGTRGSPYKFELYPEARSLKIITRTHTGMEKQVTKYPLSEIARFS